MLTRNYTLTAAVAALTTTTAAAYQAEANNVMFTATNTELTADSAAVQNLFNGWSSQFVKSYASVEEEAKRRAIWLKNHLMIMEHNAGDSGFKLGHNQFSDMTYEEFRAFVKIGEYAAPVRAGVKPEAVEEEEEEVVAVDPVEEIMADETDGVAEKRKLRALADEGEEDEKVTATASAGGLPEYVNWVEQGAVSSVKNQGMCGSCWSFSAVGAIEGAFAIHSGELVEFSEQQLVDCDTKGAEPDMGCNGGLMDSAFAFEKTEKGLCTYQDYPYVGKQQTCADTSCDNVEGSAVTGFVDVTPESNEALMEALTMQPVAIAIEADQLFFQFYRSGVFSSKCGTNLDHGVLAVGYGTDEESGSEYWLVKNSWGETWGESGYIRLVRDSTKDDAGQCGIMLMASYPTYN